MSLRAAAGPSAGDVWAASQARRPTDSQTAPAAAAAAARESHRAASTPVSRVWLLAAAVMHRGLTRRPPRQHRKHRKHREHRQHRQHHQHRRGLHARRHDGASSCGAVPAGPGAQEPICPSASSCPVCRKQREGCTPMRSRTHGPGATILVCPGLTTACSAHYRATARVLQPSAAVLQLFCCPLAVSCSLLQPLAAPAVAHRRHSKRPPCCLSLLYGRPTAQRRRSLPLCVPCRHETPGPVAALLLAAVQPVARCSPRSPRSIARPFPV